MLEYELVHTEGSFGIKNDEGAFVLHPTSGFDDFLCSFVEDCLVPSGDIARLRGIPDTLPDYQKRLIDLVVGLYNGRFSR